MHREDEKYGYMSNFDQKTSKENTVPMLRSENNMKMDHRVRGCESVGQIQPVEYKIEHVRSSCLSNYKLPKADLATLCQLISRCLHKPSSNKT